MPPSRDKATIDNLKKQIQALEDRLKQYITADEASATYTKEIQDENEALKTQNEQQNTQITEATKALADLVLDGNLQRKTIEAQDKEIKELSAKYNEVLQQLRTAEEKLNSKSIVSQRKTDITDKIDGFMHVIFRTIKFFNVEMQPEVLNGMAKMTYAYLMQVHPHLSPSHAQPFPYSLDEDEFLNIYKGYIFTKTGHMRTSTQSQAKKAAKEWWLTHNDLPTVTDVENIYALDLTSPDCSEQDKALAKWWQYDFLGLVVGPSTWSGTGCFDNRKYRIPTDKIWIKELGENRVAVTITSEAFARVIYKNNRERWLKIFKYKAEHGAKAKIPDNKKLANGSDNPEYSKFKAQWSDSYGGQGSGWDPGAMVYFNTHVNLIQKFREEEQSRDPPDQHYRQVLHLIQDEHQIEHDTPFPTTTPGKKRKRSANGPLKESPPALTILDE